ncbi:hypothetical protein Bca52824_018276 [Brassica carinata]|uniref:Uncharacterized protein n=1 Tax=Brassica carinata TaxID=52824 RepID=A0A8X7VPR2_BRACI|nr:hypothetical protein Bca52824_018276 [Brassica carinata]
MREVSAGASIDEEIPNMYSPSGSATTGFSGGSSSVYHTREPGALLREMRQTVEPNATDSEERGNKFPKRPAKISHWKLAKLNSNEVTRVVARARARSSSSVLRLIENLHAQDDELSSSGTISVVSSVSRDANGDVLSKEMRNNEPRLPLLHEAMAVTLTPIPVVLLPQDSSSGKPPPLQKSYILVLDTAYILNLYFLLFSEEVGPLVPVAISIAAGFSGNIAAAASNSFDTARTHSERAETYYSEEMRLGWLEALLQLQLSSEAVRIIGSQVITHNL